jgi:hypothetical protein
LEFPNVSSLERKVRSDTNKRAAKRRTILGLMFIEYIARHKIQTGLAGTRLPKKESEAE